MSVLSTAAVEGSALASARDGISVSDHPRYPYRPLRHQQHRYRRNRTAPPPIASRILSISAWEAEADYRGPAAPALHFRPDFALGSAESSQYIARAVKLVSKRCTMRIEAWRLARSPAAA